MKKQNTKSAIIIVDSNIEEIDQDKFLPRIARMLTEMYFQGKQGFSVTLRDSNRQRDLSQHNQHLTSISK